MGFPEFPPGEKNPLNLSHVDCPIATSSARKVERWSLRQKGCFFDGLVSTPPGNRGSSRGPNFK